MPTPVDLPCNTVPHMLLHGLLSNHHSSPLTSFPTNKHPYQLSSSVCNLKMSLFPLFFSLAACVLLDYVWQQQQTPLTLLRHRSTCPHTCHVSLRSAISIYLCLSPAAPFFFQISWYLLEFQFSFCLYGCQMHLLFPFLLMVALFSRLSCISSSSPPSTVTTHWFFWDSTPSKSTPNLLGVVFASLDLCSALFSPKNFIFASFCSCLQLSKLLNIFRPPIWWSCLLSVTYHIRALFRIHMLTRSFINHLYRPCLFSVSWFEFSHVFRFSRVSISMTHQVIVPHCGQTP